MMVGRFGEAPQKIRVQGARTPSPPTPLRAAPPTERSNKPVSLCLCNPRSSRERRRWGEVCSPDPYLLRVDEAEEQSLVARKSGEAERDSAWSGEHASPQLRRGGIKRFR